MLLRQSVSEIDGAQRLMGASLLVFSNKTDIGGCMTEQEIREARFLLTRRDERLISAQALNLDTIKTHRWHILPCSAITGKNLDEGLNWVVEDGKQRLFLY